METIFGTVVTLVNRFAFFAEASAPPGQGGKDTDSFVMSIALFGSLGLVFYVLMWRPESKRKKEREETLNSLKNKDKVVTIGGLYGTVCNIEKDEVTLVVDSKNNVRLTFRRSSIERITKSKEESKKK